jgi:hypothetical protein
MLMVAQVAMCSIEAPVLPVRQAARLRAVLAVLVWTTKPLLC